MNELKFCRQQRRKKNISILFRFSLFVCRKYYHYSKLNFFCCSFLISEKNFETIQTHWDECSIENFDIINMIAKIYWKESISIEIGSVGIQYWIIVSLCACVCVWEDGWTIKYYHINDDDRLSLAKIPLDRFQFFFSPAHTYKHTPKEKKINRFHIFAPCFYSKWKKKR